MSSLVFQEPEHGPVFVQGKVGVGQGQQCYVRTMYSVWEPAVCQEFCYRAYTTWLEYVPSFLEIFLSFEFFPSAFGSFCFWKTHTRYPRQLILLVFELGNSRISQSLLCHISQEMPGSASLYSVTLVRMLKTITNVLILSILEMPQITFGGKQYINNK